MATLRDRQLGIIGAGNMAEALVRGVLAAGLIPAGKIVACDPDAARRQVFAELGVRVSADNRAATACAWVVLAIKPQVVAAVVKEAGFISGTLLVSLLAGITTRRLAALLPAGVRIVRVMPNTPMLVNAGAAGVARGPRATEDDLHDVLSLFRSAGVAYPVAEDQLDAVTALSGSGPAYVFRFTEALAAAGAAAGLAPELAADLARQTVIGAARLLEKTGSSPAELRELVTSPGGATEAALTALTGSGFEPVIAAAVDAARRRSLELGTANGERLP